MKHSHIIHIVIMGLDIQPCQSLNFSLLSRTIRLKHFTVMIMFDRNVVINVSFSWKEKNPVFLGPNKEIFKKKKGKSEKRVIPRYFARPNLNVPCTWLCLHCSTIWTNQTHVHLTSVTTCYYPSWFSPKSGGRGQAQTARPRPFRPVWGLLPVPSSSSILLKIISLARWARMRV